MKQLICLTSLLLISLPVLADASTGDAVNNKRETRQPGWSEAESGMNMAQK